ncbi:creatininase family protein [Candidatus Poribacteria bacterium]|nr:creatininase family protein [Candidatus Poribacteria bacterium]
MRLADLTWHELRAVAREAVVVIPLGSLEQHSTHLPFATDSHILNALLDRLEAELERDVLILPPLWIAYSARHLPIKGTVSVPFDAYVDVVTGIVSSLAGAGFGRILLLNGQSDNDAALGAILRKARECHAGLAVVAVSYWALADRPSTSELAWPGHAGDLETSLLLHLRPEAVRRGEIARDEMASSSPHAADVVQYVRIDQCSHHGGVGDPEFADADKGERLFEGIASRLVALIRDYRDGILTR